MSADKKAAEKPEQDVRSLNLYQKLAAITGEVGIITKDGRNQEQKFDFISYAAVSGRLRDLFAKYGVVIVPNMAQSAAQQRVEIVSKYGAKGVAVLINFEFNIINADQPDQNFVVPWTGEAADYGDKATNKAATSALKYYMMRQFNISEKGEDPDAESPDRGTAEPKPQPAKQTAAPAAAPVTTKQLFQYIDELLARHDITDEYEKQAIVYGIADVADPSLLTVNKLKAVIRELRQESAESLRRLYLGKDEADTLPEDDAADQSVVDDLDVDQAVSSIPDEPHDGTTVFMVPKFPGEGGKIIPPAMTQQINDWIQRLGWDELTTVNFMYSVINKQEPALRPDAEKVLELLADELNAQEALSRDKQENTA